MSNEELERIRSIRPRFDEHVGLAVGNGLPPAMAESLALERLGREPIEAIDKLLAEIQRRDEMTE